MEHSTKLIRNTKRIFFSYSLIGVSLVAIVSFFALQLHIRNIDRQASIQKMHSMITGQINAVNRISLLSEKFNESKNKEVTREMEVRFTSLLNELNRQSAEFTSWLDNNDSSIIRNIKDLLKFHNISNKTFLFVEKARELTSGAPLTRYEVISNIKFLTDDSREGLGDILTYIGKRLQNEQAASLALLNKMGFILVGLCVLQVILIWLLVFKPLHSTVLVQHEKISDAMLKAKSASRSKTDFLANISHEIRTPMTAILGYVNILKREDIATVDKSNAIKIIDQNASHLLTLIDEILDIAKIEAGKFDFENEEVDLSSFLNEVFSLINVKSKDKGIELIFKNKGKIPDHVSTDPKRLKQILFNILGNAIKFTEEGYVELTVSYLINQKKLCFLVKDTGVGISPEQKKKLFKPFVQADTSVARRFGGTGLGLVLSKGLAQGMGGDVNIISSKVGVGTTMQIVVDVGETKNIELVSSFSTNVIEDNREEVINFDLKNKKILVVDDAKENARLFKLYLCDAGAEVEVAHDGQTAIDFASKKFFDLILLDLQMPGKDGFQVIEELRRNSFNRPVVALTAHAMKEEKDKTKRAGFNGHITKPVRPNFLIQSVSELIHNETIRSP